MENSPQFSTEARNQEEQGTVDPGLAFVDGAMVPASNAALYVSRVAAKNGANAYEGICVYGNEKGQLFLFRAKDHLDRLRHSLQVMQIDCDYSESEYTDAILKSLRANRIRGDAHVRLTVFITGEGAADARGPVSVVCTVKARPSSPLHARAVNAAISTWRRIDDAQMSPRGKAEANYHNTHFGLLEVFRNGYDQAIFLSEAGKVSGGGHASFLMVQNGVLITPPVSAGSFMGVTRSTLADLARNELGLQVEEREIGRSELLLADEALLCGSGQEIRPVISINKALINSGDIGPVTRRLWDAYQGAVRGWNRSRAGWLTRVGDGRSTNQSSIVPGEVGTLLDNGFMLGESSV